VIVYFYNEKDNLNINIAIKDGNIYIDAKNNRVEVIDDNSAIELVDDHYKKIDKSIYEQHDYNLDDISDKKYKPKYKSINGFIKSVIKGFRTVFNYTILKKILLVGFFASSLFIVYSISNMAGVSKIDEKDFIQVDRNYLKVEMPKVSVDDFLKYEALENVDFIIPGDSMVSFKYESSDYFQTARYMFEVSGSLMSMSKVQESDIVLGRMPENDYEILLDTMIGDKLIYGNNTMIKYLGIKDKTELLNKKLTIDNLNDFTIVGFVSKESPSIYAYETIFVNLLANTAKSDFGGMYYTGMQEEKLGVKDYSLYLDDITLVKGKLPENDYEVIVNNVNKETMKLNKTISEKVNDTELKVVGYYTSKTDRQDYLVNNNTIKYNTISNSNGFMVYPKGDKNSLLNEMQSSYNLNVYDKYQRDLETYEEQKKDAVRSSIIFAVIILVISLIEIFLMIRSSFLSRIKEIGVLRAIGVKKADIYRMFIGEIFAITTIAGMPGILLMTYILYNASKVSYFEGLFVVNSATFIISVVLVYAFNLIVGVLPIHKVLKKRPAQILARHDIWCGKLKLTSE